MKAENGKTKAGCCPPKPSLAKRPLLGGKQAEELAELFSMLANDTRLRLLHALVRSGEASVNKLAEAVGMKPQAVSNQLQRLSDRGIVASRREGTSIIYHVADPCVAELLDRGWCLREDSAGRIEVSK